MSIAHLHRSMERHMQEPPRRFIVCGRSIWMAFSKTQLQVPGRDRVHHRHQSMPSFHLPICTDAKFPSRAAQTRSSYRRVASCSRTAHVHFSSSMWRLGIDSESCRNRTPLSELRCLAASQERFLNSTTIMFRKSVASRQCCCCHQPKC